MGSNNKDRSEGQGGSMSKVGSKGRGKTKPKPKAAASATNKNTSTSAFQPPQSKDDKNGAVIPSNTHNTSRSQQRQGNTHTKRGDSKGKNNTKKASGANNKNMSAKQKTRVGATNNKKDAAGPSKIQKAGNSHQRQGNKRNKKGGKGNSNTNKNTSTSKTPLASIQQNQRPKNKTKDAVTNRIKKGDKGRQDKTKPKTSGSVHKKDMSESVPSEHWWVEAPFSPYPLLIHQGNKHVKNQLSAFEKTFGARPPLQKWPRMDIQLALRRKKLHNFVRCLLKERYGKSANGLPPQQFSENLQLLQVNQPAFMRKFHGDKKIYFAGPPKCPKDWHFDHYGVVTSLVVSAFASLSNEEQERVDVQRRLVEALLGGREEIVTDKHVDGLDLEEWACQSSMIPETWEKGEGTVLMKKAWDIWTSFLEARLSFEMIKAYAFSQDYEAAIRAGQEAVNLACFDEMVLRSISSPIVQDATSWDVGSRLFESHALISALVSTIYCNLGNAEAALELVLKSKALHKEYQYVARLTLYTVHALVALERYQEARHYIRETQMYIECERRRSGNESALADELAKVRSIRDSLKKEHAVLPPREPKESTTIMNGWLTERAGLPSREPKESKIMNGWWTFDASCSKQVDNALAKNERPSVGLWKGHTYPLVRQLYLLIGRDNERSSLLDGLAAVFPNLKKLVIEDSTAYDYKSYDLSELTKLSATLEYLELNLTWMTDKDDELEPLASLTNLRYLRIQRLRGGGSWDIKHIEKLHHLERLFYMGGNLPHDSLPDCAVLDLSRLMHLKSAVFVETSFSSESENCTRTPALILPTQLKHVTCLNVYGSTWTSTLRKELRGRGVDIRSHEIDARRMNEHDKKIWSDVKQRYEPWYPISDETV